MALTIEDAREVTLDLLNDPTGVRYAPPTDGETTAQYRRVDRALNAAASMLLDEYLAKGGTRFNEQLTGITSSATDGTVELDAYHVAHIKAVMVAEDDTFVAIRGGDHTADYLPDEVARTLRLTVVRHFPVSRSPDPDDLLMGTVAGAARSWPAYDQLICAMAADSLGAKDRLTNAAITRAIERGRAAVIQHVRLPAALPWPERRISESYLPSQLRWLWFEREQRLQLVYGRS